MFSKKIIVIQKESKKQKKTEVKEALRKEKLELERKGIEMAIWAHLLDGIAVTKHKVSLWNSTILSYF